MNTISLVSLVTCSIALSACSNSDPSDNALTIETPSKSITAMVSAVSTSGTSGSYSFSVTIESPDTGCDQYADWWEVLRDDGSLVYRRILTHSHATEQPFTRSGGPVNIAGDETIFIRTHMNNTGYSENVLNGNIEDGFLQETLNPSFQAELAFLDPLPANCAF